MSDNTETNATVSEEVSTGTEVNSPDTESPLAYENKKYRKRAQEAESENLVKPAEASADWTFTLTPEQKEELEYMVSEKSRVLDDLLALGIFTEGQIQRAKGKLRKAVIQQIKNNEMKEEE